MENSDRRNLEDRRKKPTPGFSLYSFFGKRKGFRRKSDQEKGEGYVDRYSPGLLFLLLLIASFNILDAFLTMIILDSGGVEFNPFVRYIIKQYGDDFWVWKFVLVSISVVFLCLHSKFKRLGTFIAMASLIYIGIVLYQIVLISSIKYRY